MGRLIKAEFVWQIARTAHTLMDFHSYSMVTVDSTNIDVVILYMYLKVTIRPEFFGAAPNFEGLSQKNMRLSGMLNCPEFQPCPEFVRI